MQRIRYLLIAFLSISTLCIPFRAHAQEDPGLASMIFLFTEKAESELKSQEAAMALETTGHIWTAEEWNKVADIQRVYNDYLDSFRDVVVYAAQIYGFYQEVDRMVGYIRSLDKVIQEHPQGIFAGALSAKRNQVYREIIMGSVDIVNDIRKVCLSDTKMTEQQRIEIVFGIRPKLMQLNRHLVRLIRVVKYSSFTDILIDIELLQRQPTDKQAITRACLARWKNKGRIR